MKVVIIGGVAGGATCAARLRRLDEQAEIIILERGEYVSFANCGLPYHIGGAIADRDDLLVQTPEGFKQRFKIEVRLRHTVTAIDRAARTVTVRLPGGGVATETYDRLVLSPGAEPRAVNIPGLPAERLLRLRTLADMDAIIARLQGGARAITVIGAGFIGVEVAENLRARGLAAHIIEAAPQAVAPLDSEMAALVHAELRAHGVACHFGTTVTQAETLDGRIRLTLAAGGELLTDAVIVAVGVVAETGLAQACGLRLGPSGGIAVDEQMRTSDQYIYAAGDAVEIVNRISGKPAMIPLAGPANKQARVIADNLAGGSSVYRGAIGSSVMKVFTLTAGAAGLNARQCRQAKIAYQSVIIHAASHAGYYPGAQTVSVKIVFAPDGKLLGGQVVGGAGADKRIDVLAAIIGMGGGVADLCAFEQAYAPPYSSAKDPVNLAGFAAENLLTGKVRGVAWHEVAARQEKGAVVLDVRTPREFARGHIAEARNIPVDDLRAALPDLPRDKTYIVHCQVGLRSYLACRILMQQGFREVFNLSGGYFTYAAAQREAPAPAGSAHA